MRTTQAIGKVDFNQRDSRYRYALAIFFIAAVALRVFYILKFQWNIALSGDDYYFHWQGWMISKGLGISDPFVYFGTTHGNTTPTMAFASIPGRVVPGAFHPPLLSFLIALMDLIGIQSSGGQIIFISLITSGAVPLIGLTVLGLAGKGASYVAMILACFYPGMFIFSGRLLGESLAQFLVALFLYLIYRRLKAPNIKLTAAIAVVFALSILTRSEMILFGVVPLFLYAVQSIKKKKADNLIEETAIWRFKDLGIIFAVVIVIVGPWVFRNMTSFKYPEYISADFGTVLAGSNCNSTFYGPEIGYNNFGCNVIPKVLNDDSVFDQLNVTAGEKYISSHLGRLPFVVLARVGRVYYVFNPVQQAAQIGPGISSWPKWTSVSYWILSYPMELMAVIGFIFLKRRNIMISPMMMVFIASAVAVGISYGDVRFRAIVEVPLVIGASIGTKAIHNRIKGIKSP